MVMMTDSDLAEEEESDGMINTCATIRTVLALRNVIYSNLQEQSLARAFQNNLRVVVQINRDCPFLQHANFVGLDGHSRLWVQDLSRYINSLLFVTASKPGLSRVMLDLFDFQVGDLFEHLIFL